MENRRRSIARLPNRPGSAVVLWCALSQLAAALPSAPPPDPDIAWSGRGPVASHPGGLPSRPSIFRAQDPSVRAFLSSPQVGVGREFVLNVEVSGTQRLERDPVLPPMEAFARYLGSGTTTSMQMVNGRTSVAVTYQYRFHALAEGSFEIGAVEVGVGSRTLATEPVTLVVSSAPPPTTEGTENPGEAVSAEDLFLETTVGKTRAFENEPLAIEYRIFFRVDVQSYTITSLPKATGFWTEELEQPDAPPVERVVRDGREYLAAVVRRAILFPTGSGMKTLDPLSLEAQVRVRNRRTPDPFGDFFGRSGLLGRRTPVAIASQPVTIEVLPPPASGRPDNFQGHVGSLNVSASVDRTSLRANEAVTFRVDLSGSGNIRALGPPEVDFPADFEVFPPEARERIAEGNGNLQGSKGYAYVLIPRVPGTFTLPSVEVSYFDSGSRTYRSTRSEPLEIEVTGGEEGEKEQGAAPTAVEPVREEIRFIHVDTPRFRRTGQPPFTMLGFWLVLLAPVAAVAGAAVIRRHRDRLAGDVAYVRMRRAGRTAKKRLARAKGLASGDPVALYGEVAGALLGFFADKVNVPVAGLVREDVDRLARERGVSAHTLERLFTCLDDCDRQRFAPAGAQREPPERVLARAAHLIKALAREMSG